MRRCTQPDCRESFHSTLPRGYYPTVVVAPNDKVLPARIIVRYVMDDEGHCDHFDILVREWGELVVSVNRELKLKGIKA